MNERYHGKIANAILHAFAWILAEAWEKLNFVGNVRKLWGLGKKYGTRFFIGALIWECVEDIVFPFISWKNGHPEFIPVFLVLHFEFIIWPIMFWCFRTYDRLRGREPWEPERAVMSTHTRSLMKVATHQLVAVACFWIVFSSGKASWWPLTIYTFIMTIFKFVHERIWHDWSFGIVENDEVLLRRVVVKTLSYRCASIFVMWMVFGVLGAVNSLHIATYQLVAVVACFFIELAWRRSKWGLVPTGRLVQGA